MLRARKRLKSSWFLKTKEKKRTIREVKKMSGSGSFAVGQLGLQKSTSEHNVEITKSTELIDNYKKVSDVSDNFSGNSA